MKRLTSLPLATLSGVLVIALYCVFTFTSWAFYPDPFGPATHYLSRLGNFNYNPFGAYFYNWGCILTGVVLIPFFIGMKEWYNQGKSAAKYVLIIGQLVGLMAAIALVMIGVFSEDLGEPHMVASSVFFELNFVTLILISLSLLLHPEFLKVIGLYGLAINILSLIFAIYVGGPLVEWFTVFGALVFVGLISYNTMQLQESE